MKKLSVLLLLMLTLTAGAHAQKAPSGLVFVQGGTFKNTKSNYYGKHVTVSSFYIGRYEVSQKEWVDVMGTNPSKFKGDNMPVEMVCWYDCVDYCNKRSVKEGLAPYYNISKDIKDPYNNSGLDQIKWTVTINPDANGYRLPTEAEWEYAADGGQVTRNYKYSGSNNIDKVAWYWENSGDKPLSGFWYLKIIQFNHDKAKPIGDKAPNELGLYDMSGNTREWCWDWSGVLATNTADPKGPTFGSERVWKGGGWLGADFCCEPAFRGSLEANGMGPDQGFRLCRSNKPR